MKKLLISALALFAIVSSTLAQKGFSVSVFGTPQFSWMHNSTDKDNSSFDAKSKFGVNTGLGAQYNFTDNVGIALNALYSFQGQKYTLAGVDHNQKNNYLKIPLLFSYNTNPAQKIMFIGQLGPQLSVLTKATTEDEGTKTDTKDLYKSITFGGVASAGVQFLLTKSVYLNTALRYDYDFTNAEKNNVAGYPAGRAKTYNNTLGLQVGLKYQF